MPEVYFTVRWPDDSVSECYSPSTVIQDHLEVGKRYPVSDFLSLSRTALDIASERVRQKYGYACSSAMDQLRQIERTAAGFDGQEGALVMVEGFDSRR